MSRSRLAVLAAGVALLAIAPVVRAAGTATFTADDTGTFPKTLRFDAKAKVLEVDLSGLPADAGVFRAELVLKDLPPHTRPPLDPTAVYPEGRPAERLKFVPPGFRGLDALEAVREALAARRPLRLTVETTLAGVERLEVSGAGVRPRAAEFPRASALRATHRRGQTLIVFAEPRLAEFPALATGADVAAFRDALLKMHAGLTLRVWRAAERITPASVARARLVGECGLLTAWNGAYHQDDTRKKPPVRYAVTDGGPPLEWGTGVWAHHPTEAGRAWYAVSVALRGEEDLGALGAADTTADALEETVGPGDPVLQWIERPEEWMYRKGPLTRLIYTRWESRPRCSTPSTPIDYLVAVGDRPVPDPPAREPEARAFRADPAPVGLHLHCWGGSLNGGYGWWYNAHRGAVLIASNQVPYDWWTGYHERRGTARTFGDGFVRPFTMDRMLAFLDWASRQWQEAPETVRPHWPRLDLSRVFTAGNSMGGSGAPMLALRHGDRIAWCNAWVGVHVPELSPQFQNSYENVYGPRDPRITMPDGRTSPWDWFADPWWLRRHPRAETGLIIASNGKDDGGIGWAQAHAFARALQETRRPHIYNWGMSGHGTRTLVGANLDLDLRSDQSLPAFTNGSLDGDIGTGRVKTKEECEAEKARLAEEAKQAGRDPGKVRACPTDGDPEGAYNAHLTWRTDDLVDAPDAWELTVVLKDTAPRGDCRADLTPRRLQRFRTPRGARFAYTVTDARTGKALAEGTAEADEFDLLTLPKIPLVKGANRVRIARAPAR